MKTAGRWAEVNPASSLIALKPWDQQGERDLE
jgi:hypothetical protein